MLAGLEPRRLTCVIPCHKTGLLREVVARLIAQRYPISRIVLVDDAADDHSIFTQIREEYPDRIRIHSNPQRILKTKSLIVGLEEVETDLVLCLDADTLVADDCVELLVEHLVDEVLAVSAALFPRKTDTWIESFRNRLYTLGNQLKRFVNGSCFLSYKKTLQEWLPKLTTLVEDEELSYLMTKAHQTWFYCVNARAFTEEPNSAISLLKQLVRWDYGQLQLRTLKNKLAYLVAPFATAFFTFIFVWTTALGVISEQYVLLAFPIGASILLALPYLVSLKQDGFRSKLFYRSVDFLAVWIAAARFTIGWRPKWN